MPRHVDAWDYSTVANSLRALHVPDNAVVMVHSNTGWLGMPRSGSIPEQLLRGLLGQGRRTVILPAFTYSFSRGETFDPAQPPPEMGILSERAMSTFERSLDPMFSLFGAGPRAARILRATAQRSFGSGSSFYRLCNEPTFLVSINLDAGATVLHELEHQAGVDYRFEKTFHGTVLGPSGVCSKDWVSYVRDLSNPGTEADFGRLTRDSEDLGIWRREPLGKGYIAAAELSVVSQFIAGKLEKEPLYLTVAGANPGGLTT